MWWKKFPNFFFNENLENFFSEKKEYSKIKILLKFYLIHFGKI
jgi:hypothetical protein